MANANTTFGGETHRGIVYARNGGAASAQPLVSATAFIILQRGGSFIDAGIAASAVLAVVEPAASGLGGDCFLITHNAKTKENLAFNGSGEAPHKATREEFPTGIPIHGFKAATIPGLVSSWYAAHEKFGKLSMKEILAPAIEYAEKGFPADKRYIFRMHMHMQKYPNGSELFKKMGISTDISIGKYLSCFMCFGCVL